MKKSFIAIIFCFIQMSLQAQTSLVMQYTAPDLFPNIDFINEVTVRGLNGKYISSWQRCNSHISGTCMLSGSEHYRNILEFNGTEKVFVTVEYAVGCKDKNNETQNEESTLRLNKTTIQYMKWRLVNEDLPTANFLYFTDYQKRMQLIMWEEVFNGFSIERRRIGTYYNGLSYLFAFYDKESNLILCNNISILNTRESVYNELGELKIISAPLINNQFYSVNSRENPNCVMTYTIYTKQK